MHPLIAEIATVAFGGALGAVGRYAVTALLPWQWSKVWMTAAANVSGSLLIGVAWALLGSSGGAVPAQRLWSLFLITGILGGYTTFSAFSLDTLNLWLSGKTAVAALYAVATVALSLGACATGLFATKRIAGMLL